MPTQSRVLVLASLMFAGPAPCLAESPGVYLVRNRTIGRLADVLAGPRAATDATR